MVAAVGDQRCGEHDGSDVRDDQQSEGDLHRAWGADSAADVGSQQRHRPGAGERARPHAAHPAPAAFLEDPGAGRSAPVIPVRMTARRPQSVCNARVLKVTQA